MIKKVAIYVLFPLILLAGVILYLSHNPKYYTYLSQVGLPILAIILVLQLINVFLNILINKVIFDEKKQINWYMCSYTTSLSLLLNYIVPFKAGSVFQAAYLKKKEELPLAWFTSTFMVVSLIMILFAAILGVVSLIAAPNKNGLNYIFILIFYFTVATSIFVLPLFTKVFNKIIKDPRNKHFKRIKTIVNRINEGYTTMAKDKNLLKRVLLIDLSTLINMFFINYFQFLAIDAPIHVYSIGMFLSVYILSIFINLTPGSIGLREFFQMFISQVLQLNREQIVAISVIDRVSFLISVIIAILIIMLSNFIKEAKK